MLLMDTTSLNTWRHNWTLCFFLCSAHKSRYILQYKTIYIDLHSPRALNQFPLYDWPKLWNIPTFTRRQYNISFQIVALPHPSLPFFISYHLAYQLKWLWEYSSDWCSPLLPQATHRCFFNHLHYGDNEFCTHSHSFLWKNRQEVHCEFVRKVFLYIFRGLLRYAHDHVNHVRSTTLLNI